MARLRALCLALPETEERETWDLPTFRVRGKIFAMAPGAGGDIAVWCKAPPGAQQVLVGADADRFFAPPYLGPKGWVGMRLHLLPDWAEVTELVRRSYRLVAPKRLVVQADEPRKDSEETA
ncbi:MmcQ/YjbR family DNA-binding protein [Dankookia rubra]|uniref:MmcQ/YjbR family DNA-binding protein n=1 Tax=Dankookia rubra TaxID=1442381 RepID=A0A4R5QKF1_9PROT|nr:MmcQ/YjbR family DNA-binding protein [Dankookia rubra]TDH63686.1 MmcQ/YjbR family DNA-binding protein [Dankookia rubra]